MWEWEIGSKCAGNGRTTFVLNRISFSPGPDLGDVHSDE